MKDERRRHPRVAAPVLYRIIDHSAPSRRVKNISLGGVRISSDEDFAIGQTLNLELFLPNGMTIKAIAKIVWIKKRPPGSEGLYDVGMKFVNISEPALMKLDSVLDPE